MDLEIGTIDKQTGEETKLKVGDKVTHVVLSITGVVSGIRFEGRLTSIVCDSDGVERHYLSRFLKERDHNEESTGV